jgi:hypothetical protein
MSVAKQARARVIELIDEVLKGERRRGVTTINRVADLVTSEMKRLGGRKAFGAASAMKRSALEALVKERLQQPLDFPPVENIVRRAFTEYIERHGSEPELQGLLSKDEREAHLFRAIGEYLERQGFKSLADALQQEGATVGPKEQSKRKH